jgi:SAM-dependent methyltransferase
VKTYGGIKSYAPPPDAVPSEVVPGVYEGGFQLWECVLDLLSYMEVFDYDNTSVFELGCGRGLPGIYAALKGASRVVLQDFNREVLEDLTIPNVALNNCVPGVCEFSALSWDEIPSEIEQGSFDIVLASETIYRREQLESFVRACKHLVKDDGMILLSAKEMYFGLSGSVLDLITCARDGFSHEIHHFKGSAYSRDVVVMRPKVEGCRPRDFFTRSLVPD